LIISKIKYGLGNQMLQYALGKRMAQERNTEFRIETFWYKDNKIDPETKVRSFQLDHFHTDLKPISRWMQYRYLIPPTSSRMRMLRGFLQKLGLHPASGYLEEQETEKFQYSERVLGAKGENLFLHGVWAHLGYFQPVLQELRERDFTFKVPPDADNQPIAEQIQRTTSVAVHIRKGDYLVGKFANYLGGICSPEYYAQAFNLILEQHPDAHFFLFSDDFAWVRKHIELPKNHTIVDQNDAYTAYKDLQLMTLCKHAIIANSTFSYWGALLGEDNPNRIVIAPSQWHSADNGQVHLYPDTWQKI
jgi:hypothetical protein